MKLLEHKDQQARWYQERKRRKLLSESFETTKSSGGGSELFSDNDSGASVATDATILLSSSESEVEMTAIDTVSNPGPMVPSLTPSPCSSTASTSTDPPSP